MAYCCVPKCKSSSKKSPGLSFHEIPSRAEDREKWFKVLCRDNWEPNSTSNYSRVCGKHFLPEDYLKGLKRSRLRPGAVPSVFKDIPGYVQKEGNPPPTPPLVVKRSEINSAPSNEVNTTPSNYINPVAYKKMVSEIIEDSRNRQSVSRVEKFSDKAIQVDIPKLRAQVERKQLLRKVRNLQKQNADLRNKLEEANEEITAVKKNSNFNNLRKIIKNAGEMDSYAQFILDQFRNYDKAKPTWSRITLKHSVHLRDISKSAYEHFRWNKLLKLPSRNTLTNYLDTLSGVSKEAEIPLEVTIEENNDQIHEHDTIEQEVEIQEEEVICNETF